MARQPDAGPDNPAQLKGFLDLAAEVEGEGSQRVLAAAVRRLARHGRQEGPKARPGRKSPKAK
jgi:hypothetical protein